MNLTNIINKELTWYKDIDVKVDTTKEQLCFHDKRTGASYTPATAEAALRMFRDIGSLRKACGVL